MPYHPMNAEQRGYIAGKVFVAFSRGLPMPHVGDDDDEEAHEYAQKLWAALLKGDQARLLARARGASFDVQERAARVAWRVADRVSWSDYYEAGATLRIHNSRVEAANKQHEDRCWKLKCEIFDCEHEAALALHATEKAVAAQDKVRAFKAHKRAGKAAWRAACKKQKLWNLGWVTEPIEHDETLRWQVRARINRRKKEIVDAMAIAQRYWVAADNLNSTLYAQRPAPRDVYTLWMHYALYGPGQGRVGF